MRYLRKSILSLAICVGPGTAVLACTPPDGQARQTRHADTVAAKETRVFSKAAGQIASDVGLAMNENKYDLAISLLKEALESKTLNAYETATINQFLGSSLYELEQYQGAIDAFEAAISSGGLLLNEATNLRINIAQLLIANGKPAEGAQMLEDWAEDGGCLKPKHIEYLWQAWSQAEQYDRALPWAEKWFENATRKDIKHYMTMIFFYDALDLTEQKVVLQNQMTAQWPRSMDTR